MALNLEVGETVLQEKDKILDRFADHFDPLLNNPGDLSEEASSVVTTCIKSEWTNVRYQDRTGWNPSRSVETT